MLFINIAAFSSRPPYEDERHIRISIFLRRLNKAISIYSHKIFFSD